MAGSSMVELGAISLQVQEDLSSQRSVRSMETLTRELVRPEKFYECALARLHNMRGP